MSDSCRPRKLDAGFAGRYLISSVLMTSTMKSDPGTPLIRDNSFGVAVSATATCMVGGSADGRRGALALDCVACVAARAAGNGTVVAAPATATPARNPRRLTSGRASFRARSLCARSLFLRAMKLSPVLSRAATVEGAHSKDAAIL